ncbi:PREDICTED: protein D3-like [Priapulus caudatus]|uniref:Protein D3-like n=1 Tax=Priapulus caudatus TaxID=37621 RepID=A0ABM1E5T2_PRICU|nr:PREDICTED: protein D3-like [Priapulus caudatus]
MALRSLALWKFLGVSFLEFSKPQIFVRGSAYLAMEKHEIVPDVVDKVAPNSIEIEYESCKVNMGDELTPTQVQKQPKKMTWPCDKGKFYTLIMTDPDAPSRKNPKFREWHHWMVGNIPGCDVHQGETLSEYVGSGPPEGTGLHRYVFMVYEQPGQVTFKWKKLYRSAEGRASFKTKEFAASHNLDGPVACNMYQAQYDEYVPKLYEQLSGK